MRTQRLLSPARAAAWLLAGALICATGFAAETGDVTYQRSVPGMDDIPPAIFPHWVHRMQYKCHACHEELFKMKAGATVVTMEGIKAGQTCGVCHNGKAAFEANFDTCLRCHYK